MTVLEMLWAVFVFCFMLLAPGFTLIRLIFPRRGELGGDYEMLYQFILSLMVSVLILVMVDFLLDALSDVAGYGLVRPNYILGCLVILCAGFFLIGWWRGAYPFMGWLHPSLMRHPQPLVLGVVTTRKRQSILEEMDDVAHEIRVVRAEIAGCERKISSSKGADRVRHMEKRKQLNDRLLELSNKFRELEESRGA